MAWNCKVCGKLLDDSEEYCSYCGNPQNPENEADEAAENDPYEDELDNEELEEYRRLKRDTDKLISQSISYLRIIGIFLLIAEIGFLILLLYGGGI